MEMLLTLCRVICSLEGRDSIEPVKWSNATTLIFSSNQITSSVLYYERHKKRVRKHCSIRIKTKCTLGRILKNY